MTIINKKEISSVETIKNDFPLSRVQEESIRKHRKEIESILEGKDRRKIIILGPCSAWPKQAVIEYAKKLAELQKEFPTQFKFIMRVYTQKPRTTLGWTGPLNQPDPFDNPDIDAGIRYSREMMREIADLGVPIADEALFTHGNGYLNDLLSWVAIGARSSEDQEHRIYASMIDHPVGLKNPTSGNIQKAINSVVAAQHSHTFLLHGSQVTSKGNSHAHLILRGGEGRPNISEKELIEASTLLKENIQNPSILIDASHENSIDENGKKNPLKQPDVVEGVLEVMKKNEQLRSTIKGFMIESFFKSGKQNIDKLTYETVDKSGLSITDECISFDEIRNFFRKSVNLF